MNEQKKIKRNKLITQVIAVIIFVIILILSLITLASTVKASNLAFGKYKFYIMRSESQHEIATPGDLVIVKSIKLGGIQPQDKVVYNNGEFYYCDSVIETKKVNTINKIIVAEKDGVKYQFSESEIEGKVICTIHELGNIIAFLRTPIGMVFYILLLACLFALLKIAFTSKEWNIKGKQQIKIQKNNSKTSK